MKSLCAKHKLELADVIAVGDGANDIDMVKAAGLGVAFPGSNSLREQANVTIQYSDLSALLYIKGFAKTEFVLT